MLCFMNDRIPGPISRRRQHTGAVSLTKIGVVFDVLGFYLREVVT